MITTKAFFFTPLPLAGSSIFSATMKPPPLCPVCSKGSLLQVRSWPRFPLPAFSSGFGPFPTTTVAASSVSPCWSGAGNRRRKVREGQGDEGQGDVVD
jgi:hypothetical protein